MKKTDLREPPMLVFYFGIDGIGGVQVLFFNIIEELFKNNIIVKLIHFSNSWLTNELDANNVVYKFLDIDEIDIKRANDFISKDDILITTMFVKELIFFRKKNPYFLFWNVYATTLSCSNKRPRWLRFVLKKKTISIMNQKNGLVQMDNTGVEFIKKRYKINSTPKYLSVPINNTSKNIYIDRLYKNNFNHLNITYIGRAVNWKVFPLQKIISDIVKLDYKKEDIVFHIITDDINKFKEMLKLNNNYFEIKYYRNLSGKKLEYFMSKISDIHFAMGLSCLEGSKLGIPSILIDSGSKEFPKNYKYRWIFESTNYNLGNILDGTMNKFQGVSLNKILSIFFDNDLPLINDLSKKSYKYTLENHNLQNITKQLQTYCAFSDLKINDILYLNLKFIKSIIMNSLRKR